MAEKVKIQVQFQRVGKRSIAKAKRDLKDLRGSSEKAGQSMKQSGSKMQNSMKKIQKNTKGTSEGMQGLRNDVKGLGNRMNKWGKKMQGNMKKSRKSSQKMSRSITNNLTFIAWHFRYLGSQLSQFSARWREMIKEIIKDAAEVEQSILSVRIGMGGFNEQSRKSLQLARDMAHEGLIPLKQSFDIVSDVAVTGVGFPVLRKFMLRTLDVAVRYKDTIEGQADSLKDLTEAVVRGKKVLEKDQVLRLIWQKTNKRMNRELGIQIEQLSRENMMLALTNTLTKEFTNTQDLHEVQAKTLQAAVNKLKTSYLELKLALAKALKPLVYFGVQAMKAVVKWTKKLMDSNARLIGIIFSVGTAMVTVGGILFTTVGLLLSIVKIASAVGMSFWSVVAPITVFTAALGFGIYKLLDYSDAFKKAGDAASSMNKKLKEIIKGMTDLQDQTEAGERISKKRRIEHQRTVSDIKEQIEEEKQKGLWADQERIDSLEKRLKREREDYQLLKEDKEEHNEEANSMFDEMQKNLKGLGETADKQTLKITKAWGEMVRDLKSGWHSFVQWIQNPDQWDEFLETVEKKVKKAGKKIYPVLGKIATKIKNVLTDPDFWESVGNIIFNLGKFIVETFKAAISGLGEALTDAIMGKGVESVDALTEAQQRLIETLEKQGASQKKIDEARRINIRQQEEVQEAWRKTQQFLSPFGGEGGGWFLNPDVKPNLFLGGPGEEGFLNIPNEQFGGRVPGAPGEPVPIIAHGGERVVPQHEAGGGIIININEPIVREDEDLQRIANEVSKVLGQKRKLTQMGA